LYGKVNKLFTSLSIRGAVINLNEGIKSGRDEEIRRLLYEIRAKGGLPPSRINRFLKQLDAIA
jgi:hypothetical protein